MHPKSLYQKIMVMKEFGPSFCANWNKKKFLHLKLQNKAHKVFGTISSWAQSCAAKNSLAFQKVVLVSLSAGWTEGKNMSKQIRQL